MTEEGKGEHLREWLRQGTSTLKRQTCRTQQASSIQWGRVFIRGSPVAQMVNNPPAMKETRVRSLGQEDPLEKGMATRSSILAWRIPWTEEPGGLRGRKELDTVEQLILSLSQMIYNVGSVSGIQQNDFSYTHTHTHTHAHRGSSLDSFLLQVITRHGV